MNNVLNLMRYYWRFSPQTWPEPKEWSHRVVSLVPAIKHSALATFRCQQGLLVKGKRLSLGLFKAFFNRPKVASESNRLSMLNHLLSLDPLKPGIYRSLGWSTNRSQLEFFITDPNIMTAILRHSRNEEGADALFSGGVNAQVARKILGNSILTCPESEHKRLKNFSSPYLTSEEVKLFFPSFVQGSSALTEKWLLQSQRGLTEITQDLPACVAGSVATNILGFDGSASELVKSMQTVLKTHSKPLWCPHHRRNFKLALKFIHQAAKSACLQDNRQTLLSRMKSAKNSKGENEFQPSDISAMACQMFFAGQDTTASALAYLIYTLGLPQFKIWQERVYAEMQLKSELNAEAVSELQSVDLLIKETLRLHPPTYAQTRTVQQDFIMDGAYLIPKGSVVHLLHYFSQRDIRRWGVDADCFIPQRYQCSHVNARTCGPYQGLSLGPTLCLGKYFVMLFMKTFIVQLIRKTTWNSQTLPEPQAGAGVNLEFLTPIYVQFNGRGNN